jgi:dienelactone hydrolase
MFVRFAFCFGVLLWAAFGAAPSAAADLVWRRFLLPVEIDGAPHQLDTLMAAEAGEKRRPIALIAHGVPRDKSALHEVGPGGGIVKAEFFARNGYAAFIVMRRGYGESSGVFSEPNGRCDNADYLAAGRETADDLRAALAGIRRRADVDPAVAVIAGQSGGGFGALALAAAAPPGLRAVVNFAGGRGAMKDAVCAESRLLDAFSLYGGGAKVPSLWIYAANDKLFPRPLHEQFFAAYQTAGGRGVWAPAPAFGEDGHGLSARRSGVALWSGAAERFLADNHLPVKPGAGRAVTAALDAPPPVRLSEKGLEAWRKYLDAPRFAVFAASPDGRHWGYASGKKSQEDALNRALELCKGPCRAVAVNPLPGR